MYITLAVAVLSALLIGTSGGGVISSISAGQVYWNNVLPKTSMPKAIQDLLPGYSPVQNGASTAKVLPFSDTGRWNGASAKVLPFSDTGRWNGASTAKVLPFSDTGRWNGASTAKVLPLSVTDDEKLKYDPTNTMYFFEENLRPGSKMTLSFPDISIYGVTFISNKQSKSIPFSSSKLPDILSVFSIKSDSDIASAMKETLATCEYKPMEGEMKHCATSLESMVDFTTSVLKNHNLISISTTTDKENTPKQEYEVTSSNIKSSGDNTVVCHAQTYAYAVFHCHKLKGVNVFDVEMVGADRTKVKAVATCHTDTSKWNPYNLALRILNVNPGTVPVCHFLPQYDVLWMAT